MKINVHAHVFNFDAIVTSETMEIIEKRMDRQGIPGILQKPLMRYLEYRFKEGKDERPNFALFVEYLKEESRLVNLISKAESDSFTQQFLTSLPVVGNVLSSAPGEKLLSNSFIERLSGRINQRVDRMQSIVQWLSVGLMENIDEVTDHLMDSLDQDEAAVLLPVNIFPPENAQQWEKERVRQQTSDTVRQALRYPGKALPFFMANPVDPDCMEQMRENIESGKCIGVKLYPSLLLPEHYDSSAFNSILDYCNSKHLPVIMHCNDGGFKKNAMAAENCNPKAQWADMIGNFPNLKFCFAHFGGLTQNGIDILTHYPLNDNNWSWPFQITQLMRKYQGRVYADLSFHDIITADNAKKDNYRKNIKDMLEDDELSPHLLFGTDFHLLKMEVDEEHYTRQFKNIAGKHFKKLSKDNPVEFLGIPVDNKGRENTARHINWLHEHTDEEKRVTKMAEWARIGDSS